MPDMPGDTFVDKRGIEYVLLHGPKKNLRPYTRPPVTSTPWLVWFGWAGLAVYAAVLIGKTVWEICEKDK